MSQLIRSDDDVVMSTSNAGNLFVDAANWAWNNRGPIRRRLSNAFSSPGGSGPMGTGPLNYNAAPLFGSRGSHASGRRYRTPIRVASSGPRKYSGGAKYGGPLSQVVKGKTYYKKGKKKMSKKVKRVKRIKRAKRSRKQKSLSYCLTKGYVQMTQEFGKVEDPNSVYITHGTWHLNNIVQALTGAILRKLITKAGFYPESDMTVLPFNNQFSANFAEFHASYQQIGNIDAPLTAIANYPTSANTTLSDVITGWTSFTTYLKDQLTGVFQNSYLYMVSLLTVDASGRQHVMASIDLQSLHFVLPVVSKLRFQNRTLPAATGSTPSTDRSDVQPIRTTSYMFNNGSPKLKLTNPRVGLGPLYNFVSNIQLSTNYQTGLLLNRGQTLNATGLGDDSHRYDEPPPSKIFNNMKGRYQQVVDPGIIKYSIVKHVYKGTLANICTKLKPQVVTGTFESKLVQTVPGKCCLLVMDEFLRTETSNPISISFEYENKVGCTVYEKHKSAFIPRLFVTGPTNL